MDKVLVRNAADKKQVAHAKDKQESVRDRELNDLRAVLATLEGRRLLWRIMGFCKTFGSIWEGSARIHYNAGQQDVGHFIMSEIAQADEEKLLSMMKESKKGEL